MDAKVDKLTIVEKFNDVNNILKGKDDELNKYKETVEVKFEKEQKIFEKLEKSIENKSDKETIWEIKDLVRGLAHKESITDLEKKVFPIMKEIITKVESFDEIIRENQTAL